LDRDFIARETVGFDALVREVLPGHTPERGAELTGMAAGEIVELALAYGRAAAPFIRLGAGNSRYGNGAMATRAILCLPAAVAPGGRGGGRLLPSPNTGGAFKMAVVTRPDPLLRPTRIVNMNELGRALNELDAPRVRSLYVHTSTPAVVAPDQNAVLRGL